jgi:hypothetical protein
MAADRRLRWLGALLVVVVVAAMVVRSGSDNTPTTESTPARPANSARGTAAPDAPPEINIDALQTARQAPSNSARDPFRFRPRPVAPAPPPSRIPGVQDDQVDAPPPRPAGPPPPPPIALKFIGLVQKADGTKIAVLSDGKRPIHGTEGEEIEGRYKILKIGLESIEIAYLDGRGRQTIPLTGQ